ncbi:hypothetical protein Baya_2427 [Bagarius yarrelli]|uniref:Uncharacterized protein n=1 Tax=Bagarius yarrelli TaxID=175774 RepID=A0A556TNX2_BAGYA|nr:hypothetical protein Baya_2427 [Bagarius yarrelli]
MKEVKHVNQCEVSAKASSNPHPLSTLKELYAGFVWGKRGAHSVKLGGWGTRPLHMHTHSNESFDLSHLQIKYQEPTLQQGQRSSELVNSLRRKLQLTAPSTTTPPLITSTSTLSLLSLHIAGPMVNPVPYSDFLEACNCFLLQCSTLSRCSCKDSIAFVVPQLTDRVIVEPRRTPFIKHFKEVFGKSLGVVCETLYRVDLWSPVLPSSFQTPCPHTHEHESSLGTLTPDETGREEAVCAL